MSGGSGIIHADYMHRTRSQRGSCSFGLCPINLATMRLTSPVRIAA
ncbi:hypothetical protein P5G65_12040 [Paenibacillus chondroitinus]|uniref:Uncharacterized protein n=1 Tax=Paenibacillus chondroitinus TaxID=59842 RepID=A0ABU6DCK9_9BACL|nr:MULTISPECIES: hypothetical protein [Paenibacillus]MCY9662329.1 hypothetical protein [Paenibacillus anseongense]MEB4794631.1 hypothetical protein [Paenibacillus chondroitinus]